MYFIFFEKSEENPPVLLHKIRVSMLKQLKLNINNSTNKPRQLHLLKYNIKTNNIKEQSYNTKKKHSKTHEETIKYIL